MKTSCLRLKLVELNFLVSFNTDDQSKTDVANAINVITNNLLILILSVCFASEAVMLICVLPDFRVNYNLYSLQEGDTSDLLTQCTHLLLWDVVTLAGPRFNKVTNMYQSAKLVPNISGFLVLMSY